MEFEIRFPEDGDPADVEITVAGEPSPEEFVELNAALEADERFRGGLTMLVDCTRLETSGLATDEVQALSEPMSRRDWRYPPAAVAIVAPDERTYEAVRAYRAHLGGSKSNRFLFRTRADAVAWLADRS